MFSERSDPENMTELIGIETTEVAYESLCQHLFMDWGYIPFRQYCAYEGNDLGLGVRGKSVVETESYSSSTGGAFMAMMRLEDIVELLHKMECTPYSSPTP